MENEHKRQADMENENAAPKETEPEEYGPSPFVYVMTFGVSLGGLCYGYNMAVISGAMLYVTPYFQLDTAWQQMIVGAAVISATASSLFSGSVSDQCGRKPALLMTAVVATAGCVLAAAAPSKEVLLIARLITGLTFPLMVAFCPLYIAEMSPASVRGRLINIQQLQTTVGMLLSAVLAGSFSYVQYNWRLMMGAAIVPSGLFVVAMLLLPETPRWLVAHGRQLEAVKVLRRLYGQDDVMNELKKIEQAVTSDGAPKGVCAAITGVMTTPHVLKALAVGTSLAFFFVWSGSNAVLFYSGMIMKMVGFPLQYAVWVQGVVPLALFIGVFPGIFTVEKYGRKPVVLISIGGSAVSMMIVSVGFHLITANVPDLQPANFTQLSSNDSRLSECVQFTTCEACVQSSHCGLCHNEASGFCLPAHNDYYSTTGPCTMNNQSDSSYQFAMDYCPSPYAWMVVAGFVVFCLFFCPGMGAQRFTINAEIYPMWARSTCNSLVVVIFWACHVLVTFFFLSIVHTFTIAGTFWFFSGMSVLGFVFLAIFLPETKNLSLEVTEELFMTSAQLQRRHEKRAASQSSLENTIFSIHL